MNGEQTAGKYPRDDAIRADINSTIAGRSTSIFGRTYTRFNTVRSRWATDVLQQWLSPVLRRAEVKEPEATRLEAIHLLGSPEESPTPTRHQ